MTTVRELIEGLSAVAAELETGLDSDVELGICDGKDLQMVNRVDSAVWTVFSKEFEPKRAYVLIRGHLHPDDPDRGELQRDAMADVDDELQRLIAEQGGEKG